MDIPVYHYDTLDSTNTQCKRLAAEGVESAVVTADCQTAGRGRMGRRFQSPPGLGLYLSVLWRTGLCTETLSVVTPLAAVAVCRAIEGVCGLRCGIKWPNDLLLGGRKVCGILTESAFRPDGTPDWVIVGIGINVSQTLMTSPPTWPLSPRPSATSWGATCPATHWRRRWWVSWRSCTTTSSPPPLCGGRTTAPAASIRANRCRWCAAIWCAVPWRRTLTRATA